MPKWRTVRLRQELVAAAKSTLETGRYRSLSQFVSEAIQLRLDELKQAHEETARKPPEYLVIQERLLYTPSHMWAMVTPEGNIRVGLSEYAQEHLKGIASIETHPVGHEVKKDEPFGVAETWMFMFDLYSPVSGRIVKINEVLQENPFTINEHPYEMMWIAEIKPDDLFISEEELSDLMTIDQYETFVLKTGRPRVLGI